MNFNQPDFNQIQKTGKKRYVSVLFFIFMAMAGLVYGVSRKGMGANEIAVDNDNRTIWERMANVFTLSTAEAPITLEKDPDYAMPNADDGRWDILVMGIRGEDGTEETGNMLTDTIMLISRDKETGKTAMVSIPRDFYVRIYGTKYGKINEVYENSNSLNATRKLFSRITGVYIDNAVIIDFSSFKSIIDKLGGVDVMLEKPFTETQQWGYEFSLPAGINHLDGEKALYYVRSRYSSSDFDRAQRQQKVMMAMKDKMLELNLLADPIKTLSILNSVRNNIITDLNIWDAGSLLGLSKQFDDADKVKRYVINTENLLYESHIQTNVGNIYVLLPNGDNLQGVKTFFQEIIK